MKASELRIGNFVTTIDDKIICTSVKGFYGFPVNTGIINHNNSVNDFEYLKPISLTEEWLLKFGFKYYNNIKIYSLNGMDIRKDDFSVVFIGLDLHYVHQLQNLYFALTGEELEIKDNDYYR